MKTDGSYAIVFAEKQLVPNQMRYQTALRSEPLLSTSWTFCSRWLHSYVNALPDALNQILRPIMAVNGRPATIGLEGRTVFPWKSAYAIVFVNGISVFAFIKHCRFSHKNPCFRRFANASPLHDSPTVKG